MKKFIDVSGFGNTGKSLAFQLIEGAFKPSSLDPEIEFELFRAPGGLFDLYISCVLFWSPMRSNKAIKDFKLLNKRISSFASKDNLLAFFTSTGNNYNKVINAKFQALGENFISQIVDLDFESIWPYDYLTCSPLELANKKIFGKLGLKTKDTIELSESNQLITNKFESYISDVLKLFSFDPSSFVLLANSVEPFGGKLMKQIYGNFSQVIVDRDPRDVYTTLMPNDGSKPDFLKNKIADKALLNTIGLDVDVFIRKYKLSHDHFYKSSSFDKNVIYRFEEIVNDPTKFIKLLAENIDEPILNSFNPTKFESSKRNVAIYQQYKDSPFIKKIEEELSEYCYL